MTVGGTTHQGAVRTTNEDGVCWDQALGFAAVADGMGGHQAGEVASALALEALHNFLKRSAVTTDFTWPFGVSPQLSLAANRLNTGFKLANKRVFKRAEEAPDYMGMGTTLTAVVVSGQSVTIASVGDSRVYVASDGELRQLTQDDSWVAALAHESGLTPAQLAQHPLRNVLTKVVGARSELDAAIQESTLTVGTLLLATDGLHNAVPADVLLAILQRPEPAEELSRVLVEEALDRQCQDNVSAVVVRL